jgi:thioredoxin 1
VRNYWTTLAILFGKGRIMYQKKQKYSLVVTLVLFSFLFTLSCSSAITSPEQTSPTQELAIELPGTQSNTILIDSQGKVVKRALISASDKSISLSLEAGTTLLDENNIPLQVIKVAVDPVIPIPPRDAEIVGAIFDIQPQGAKINPSLNLTLNYDPSALPQGVNENDLWIYSFTGNRWEMVPFRNIDTGSNRVTTTINRFGKYSVLAPIKLVEIKLLETTSPVAQPNLTSIILTEALKNGKPTLAEFGRGTCIPCKQMKPILEDLAVQYQDKLNVPIVSIDDYSQLTSYYKVMAIPTQIGFDSNGKEVFRHVGFWAKNQIIPELRKLGLQ